jgi:RuvB-like protein 2
MAVVCNPFLFSEASTDSM